MKTRRSATWGLGLIVAASFAIGASAQSDLKPETAAGQKPEPSKSSFVTATPFQPATSAVTIDRKAPLAAVSPWFTEVVKMIRAGIGPEAMLAFIDSAGTFNLGANQIIYLHDLGAPSELISAMIQHDADLGSGVLPLPLTAVPKLPPPLKTVTATTNAAPVVVAAKPKAKPVRAPVQIAAAEPMNDDELYLDYLASMGYELPALPAPPEPARFSPVRKPYPVELTDPIVVVRAPERISNVLFIQMP